MKYIVALLLALGVMPGVSALAAPHFGEASLQKTEAAAPATALKVWYDGYRGHVGYGGYGYYHSYRQHYYRPYGGYGYYNSYRSNYYRPYWGDGYSAYYRPYYGPNYDYYPRYGSYPSCCGWPY